MGKVNKSIILAVLVTALFQVTLSYHQYSHWQLQKYSLTPRNVTNLYGRRTRIEFTCTYKMYEPDREMFSSIDTCTIAYRTGNVWGQRVSYTPIARYNFMKQKSDPMKYNFHRPKIQGEVRQGARGKIISLYVYWRWDLNQIKGDFWCWFDGQGKNGKPKVQYTNYLRTTG